MDYKLSLSYIIDLNPNSDTLPGSLIAEIMYETKVPVANPDNREAKSSRIGFVQLLDYQHAKACGVDMTPFRGVMLELDHNFISQDTIDEVGTAINPNIMVLLHFGISAAWRNKGFGEQVLKDLILQMRKKCGYLVIYSEPAQHGDFTGPNSIYKKQRVELAGLETDPEKAQWKLNAFFLRCGFRLFKNYDNVFICNVKQAVAEHMKILQVSK